MITPPRRSVTRFFIPLIDVLILLFAIFLLMPFVSGPASSEPVDTKTPPKEPLPTNVAELQRQLTEARDRIARMEKAAQAKLADRLSVRVLQIDRTDGTLYYFHESKRHDVRNEKEAQKLIDMQRSIATSAGGVKDILFLILYPENPLGFPTKKQEDEIHHWFRDVQHKFQ